MMAEGCFTITFEPPFWVGIFERYDDGGYSVARIVFGHEPNDETVYQSALNQYAALDFSMPVSERPPDSAKKGYKRQQRELKYLMESGPEMHNEVKQALQAEHERQKQEKLKLEKAEREAEKERDYQLRQQKRAEKKRGH